MVTIVFTAILPRFRRIDTFYDRPPLLDGWLRFAVLPFVTMMPSAYLWQLLFSQFTSDFTQNLLSVGR